MVDRIGRSHRVFLWASLVLLTALGIAFLFAPDALLEQVGIETSDRTAGVFRAASSVLIAEAVVVGFAIRSGLWSETRYITYLLAIHFTLETVIRVAVLAMGESDSLVAAIPQAIIAVGLLVEIVRRRATSPVTAAA